LGFGGGPAYQKVCAVCHVEKPNTTYRNNGDTCTACCNEVQRQKELGQRRRGRPENLQHSGVQLASMRMTYAAHMERIGATDEMHAVVGIAADRYGMSDPCPDDVIEEYVNGHPTHDKRQLWSKMFHACVLLAHESKKKGRTGMYKPRKHAARQQSEA
jgi:hypothetical protein